VSCTKTAEPIDLPFGLWTLVSRRKHAFKHIRQVALLCEYNSTVRLRRRCGLMSNYFEHLLCYMCVRVQNGLTALHLASKEGHVHVVGELLRRDADIDIATKVRMCCDEGR